MTKIDKLRVRTEKAATTARASGMITSAQLDRITDGTVSKTDLRTAEKALAQAESLIKELKRERAPSSDKKIAESRRSVAEALVNAIDDQLSAQGTRRPSSSGGKGSTPSRPSSGGGKGGSVPSSGGGKGRPVPSRPAPSRPSTGGGKGGSVRRPGGK